MNARAPLHGRIALGALALAVGAGLQAAELPSGFATQNDWGGVGLLQTPTARMADEGQISLSTSYTSPYARHNLSMQPFPWLEGTFRYVGFRNQRYGSEALSGDQSFKDKSIDFKLRLWPESRWLPQVAVGMRDIGGTAQFASEYLVASKRFGSFDASLGVATGYIGHRGDISNPLGWIIDDFGDRPPRGSGNNQFNTNRIFRGPLGVFGGVSWQTPLDALVLKLELDGNDYRTEPRGTALDQALPVNLGLVYRPNANIELTAGIERGNTAVVGLAITGNLKHARRNAQLLDTPPPALKAPNGVPGEATPATDWPDVAAALRRDAGIRVRAISQRDRELIVHGEQTRYMYGAQGVGRAARVLDSVAGDSVDWVTVAHERVGLPIAETSVERASFADYTNRQQGLGGLARKVEVQPPALQRRHTLYEAPFDRWSYGFGPGYRHVMGGPDGFILYQVTADARGTWWFNRNTWLTGTVSVDLINNFDKFRYDAPSRLPRVRTYQRQFLTTSDVMVPNLQLTHVRQLGRDWYGMAYAGYLEYMYGGVGGEVLYRPFGERWAVGMDVNYVRQRDFDQRAGFRDYDITTGHLTGYFTFGHAQRIQGSVSAGRYLAGDLGATVSLARRFDNGVTMGAYATKTNVSSRDFGEGDFDKGIYFSVPMDFILPRPSRARATILWQPLYRDGGARLQRRYGLHPLTAERDAEFLLDNLHLMDD